MLAHLLSCEPGATVATVPDLDCERWADVLARVLRVVRTERLEKVLRPLEVLFYCRLVTVLPQLTNDSVESMVSNLATILNWRIAADLRN